MSGAGSPKDLSRKQRALRATTAERLEAIVEAAERAAGGVIDDAEAEARRYLAQARAEADRAVEGRFSELSGLVDSLLGQALSLRQEAEGLQASLEAAKERLRWEETATEQPREERPDPDEQPEAPRLRAVTPSEPTAEAEAKRSDAAGARLLATQLAVSGSSREEIELRLRNGFQIEDTGAILDAILGPEE
jgi:cell division septum initiation protein DivIVA